MGGVERIKLCFGVLESGKRMDGRDTAVPEIECISSSHLEQVLDDLSPIVYVGRADRAQHIPLDPQQLGRLLHLRREGL